MSLNGDTSIIVVDKFILATRDSGYKGTESAIAELVDNSIQAGARKIAVDITVTQDDSDYPLRISVLDDGCGMDRRTLRQALRFGGTSRFNDRTGLGRYGMGLPNSSLSQARRVEVYSWVKRGGRPTYCYLDVDEITSGRMTEVPSPEPRSMPRWVGKFTGKSGTLVVWTRCDRLDHRRVSTIARRLLIPLGRVFRYFLWDGVQIRVNGNAVEPIDPLYLHRQSARRGGTPFGKPMEYAIEAHSSNGTTNGTGRVTVRFSELPVHKWHDLPNEAKRRLGIVNGAGVSIVRAGREIDYGWFFLDGKRRENYDDWWRCEIQFDPNLDEAFGITHTKQQIRPHDYLHEILAPDLENVAKALNGRVRQAHLHVRAVDQTAEVERMVSERDQLLNPLPNNGAAAQARGLMEELSRRHAFLRDAVLQREDGALQYRIVQDSLKGSDFYSYALKEGLFVLVINPDHPFFRKVYAPLAEKEDKESKNTRAQIDMMLLSAARAEAEATRGSQRETLANFRKAWSDNLATFLNS
jgi:hypothetical protein